MEGRGSAWRRDDDPTAGDGGRRRQDEAAHVASVRCRGDRHRRARGPRCRGGLVPLNRTRFGRTASPPCPGGLKEIGNRPQRGGAARQKSTWAERRFVEIAGSEDRGSTREGVREARKVGRSGHQSPHGHEGSFTRQHGKNSGKLGKVGRFRRRKWFLPLQGAPPREGCAFADLTLVKIERFRYDAQSVSRETASIKRFL